MERARCRSLIGGDVRSIVSWDWDVPPSIDPGPALPDQAGLDSIVDDRSTVSCADRSNTAGAASQPTVPVAR